MEPGPTKWPRHIDFSPDEARFFLRKLELDTYASCVSVFRAQGDLSQEKKKLLLDLQQTLKYDVFSKFIKKKFFSKLSLNISLV